MAKLIHWAFTSGISQAFPFHLLHTMTHDCWGSLSTTMPLLQDLIMRMRVLKEVVRGIKEGIKQLLKPLNY